MVNSDRLRGDEKVLWTAEQIVCALHVLQEYHPFGGNTMDALMATAPPQPVHPDTNDPNIFISGDSVSEDVL